jgi:hypothetical protein
MQFIETSAKNGHNVGEAFYIIGKMLKDQLVKQSEMTMEQKSQIVSVDIRGSMLSSKVYNDKNKKEEKKSKNGCCK